MAKIRVNDFASWELTDDEQKEGSVYSIVQLQVLQNKLSDCAEEKNALEFNPNNPQEFIQQEAYKRGQMELLQYLMTNSSAYVEQMQYETDNVSNITDAPPPGAYETFS